MARPLVCAAEIPGPFRWPGRITVCSTGWRRGGRLVARRSLDFFPLLATNSARRFIRGDAMMVVVMGVAGSGKSTIAEILAQRLGWVFLDADQFHSPGNKEKMHRGIPLTDADRFPWLDAIHDELAANEAKGRSVVLACSALKEKYRRRLSRGLQLRFVYLKGSYELIEARMRERAGHFAGESILEDQFKTLEEPRDAMVVD